ncbi:MAG: alpha/beta fold hydrolase [Pseudomonadales bacterium]|jgi:pimeloyl-ACP methyl ester carboxylesterase|nr:alpha/beta fold hydrolase [Pseudomonadales bacterium]MDP6471934.1 alpha/beta fold hydrolase [Pseudomonadales bacterium]MDP6826796.1 alpha/beta fold hydrolase [Pseudomonadales bacterium]MDP6970926.1 alpha/beta fold hydrolase [Pseudomonadales bacterium]|tara:strand:+ start:565 stop:1392 length:828 start_codon:yes stop_codon:yes gene_type:complete
MPRAQSNGIELEYASYGEEDNPVIVLIRGLGTQMIEWSKGLTGGFAQAGFRVIAFDNRDVGFSSKLKAPYPLRAMADDVIGLMDHLSIGAAHIFGISLGGMIAQLVASRYPKRVLALYSVMSSSGNPDLPPMDESLRDQMLKDAKGREAIIRLDADNRALFGSPGYPETEADRLLAASAAYDRCYCREGVARQMAAAITDGSRVERLKEIRLPTLVIHGAQDALVPLAAGEDTAGWIAGAELAVVEGMGHNIPDALAPHIVELVSEFVLRTLNRG